MVGTAHRQIIKCNELIVDFPSLTLNADSIIDFGEIAPRRRHRTRKWNFTFVHTHTHTYTAVQQRRREKLHSISKQLYQRKTGLFWSGIATAASARFPVHVEPERLRGRFFSSCVWIAAGSAIRIKPIEMIWNEAIPTVKKLIHFSFRAKFNYFVANRWLCKPRRTRVRRPRLVIWSMMN